MFLTVFVLLPATIHAQEAERFWITDIVWSPDGTRLAVAMNEGVIVYDTTMVEAPQVLWQFETGINAQAVRFSPDGTWLAAGLGDWPGGAGWLIVWDVQTGAEITSFVANRHMVSVIAFSPDGSQVATGGGYFPTRGCGDYRVSVWDTATWERHSTEAGGSGVVTAITYSPDGHYLAFSNLNYTATQLVDADTYTALAAIHEDSAEDIIFTTDSTHLTVFFPGSVQHWELRAEPELHLVRVAQWEATCTEDADGYCKLDERLIGTHPAFFATVVETGMQVRTVDTGEIVFALPANDEHFVQASFSPDGMLLVLVSDLSASVWGVHYRADWQITLWDLSAQTPLAVLEFE